MTLHSVFHARLKGVVPSLYTYLPGSSYRNHTSHLKALYIIGLRRLRDFVESPGFPGAELAY